ncbi:N-6 DNA methylase [Opitutales bacterium]|nr:N-6 DNA methylase [Opitutales bacterium]
MDSQRDSRFNAFLEDKVQQYSFAKKLMEFCLDYSSRTDWEYFAKNEHFLINVNAPFQRSKIHFKKKYARIWMPIQKNFRLKFGIGLIKGVLGDDAELGIQDGATMRALHPVIDTDEKCEALIKWLSHQQNQISSSSNVKTASDLFKLVKEDDVLNAINAFENGLIHEFGPSTQYDLIHQGKPYPPKAILGIACRTVSGGRLLKPEEFSGGEDSACFKTLRGEGFTIQPKGKINEVEQDLSVAPNIFCMLMVHFFIQNRESMISDLPMDGNSNIYFPDDAQKYLEFKKVKIYDVDVESLQANEIVPMIEELAGEIFPYFSFMSRIAPELSKFSKSILFSLDKPEQFVEAYKIGWLGFLSILDSENFDTNHYHCLASLLRHLADTGTEDSSEQSSYFINLIKSTMSGSTKNLLVDDSFPSNYFTSNKILDQTIKFLPRRSNLTVYDPACGLGGFLMKAFDRIYSKEKNKDFSINAITGADIDPMCVNLAKVFYMCKVFFTHTECMGVEGMVKFLGEVAPNIVQQDSLSGKVGIFPESKNDFIYCNPPFDELIEGGQESSYNHHGFIKIAEEFVEKGGQAVLLLPHSFLVSQRDHHCRMGLIKKYVIRRLYEYIFSTDENDRKIVLALNAPQSRRVNKLSVRSLENNKIIKKFEVSYSLLGESENYSLSIDELERNQIKKPSTEELSPSSLGELIDEKISKIEHDIDSIAKGMHQLRMYNKAQKSLSDGDCITCNLGSILSSIYTSRFDSQFENQPHCFFPFDERRRTFILQRHYSKSNHLEKKSRGLARAGLIIYPDPSKLDPNYIDLWIRFSGIIGRYSIDMRGEQRIIPFNFSLAGRRERIIEDRFQELKVKFHEQTIFLPPIPLQRDLVGFLSNNSLLKYLIDQRKYSPVSRAKIPRQDLISLLFRFDGFT